MKRSKGGQLEMMSYKRCVIAIICAGFMLTCISSISLGTKKVTMRWMTWLTGDGLLDYKKVIEYGGIRSGAALRPISTGIRGSY